MRVSWSSFQHCFLLQRVLSSFSWEGREVQPWAAARQDAMPHGGKGTVPTHGAGSTAKACRQLQQRAAQDPAQWKLLVQTQFQNKSGFQHSAAPERDTCLLNEPVPVSQICLFYNSHLVQGEYFCQCFSCTWLKTLLRQLASLAFKCHLHQKATEPDYWGRCHEWRWTSVTEWGCW